MNWLKEIEFSDGKAVDSAKLVAKTEEGTDPYICYMESAEQDRHTLLRAYKSAIKAIEALKMAKQEKAEYGDTPVYRALKNNAWSLVDKALAYDPAKEV